MAKQVSGFFPAPYNKGVSFPYNRLPPGVTPFQAAMASLMGQYFSFPTSTKRRQAIEAMSRPKTPEQ
jgi:hypothetical protein